MSNPDDPELENFLKRPDVDLAALKSLQGKVEADNPWTKPGPSALSADAYLIREQVRYLNPRRAYDFIDAESGESLMRCQGEALTLDYSFRDRQDHQVVLLRKTTVFDGANLELGEVRTQATPSNKEDCGAVYDRGFKPVSRIAFSEGEYQFWRTKRIVARVLRQPRTFAQFWTKADLYALEFTAELAPDDPLRMMIAAAVIRLDIDYDMPDD